MKALEKEQHTACPLVVGGRSPFMGCETGPRLWEMAVVLCGGRTKSFRHGTFGTFWGCTR
jgi:hypothetical protein